MPAIIDLTGADWIWPAAETPGTWHEISEAHHDQQLGCLPPIWCEGGFLMSEAKRHDGDGIAVRSYFVTHRGRFFVQEVRATIQAVAAARVDLLRTFTPKGSILRYAITRRRNGLRVLAEPAQGRYVYGSKEEAQARLDLITSNNSPERMAEIWGKNAALKVLAVRIHGNGDPVQTVLGMELGTEEEAPNAN